VSALEADFFAIKHLLTNRWSRLREQVLCFATSKEENEFEVALFVYLIPCYITAFMECDKAEAKGVVFFVLVLQLLLSKSSTMLGENQTEEPEKPSVVDAADLIAQLWALQNKVIIFVF
jgi:hypothetical protein